MDTVKLNTLAGGALLERFDDAWQEVLDNIQDIDTEAKDRREITIKVSISPDSARDTGSVKIAVTKKLAGPRLVETVIFLGFDNAGRATAAEQERTLNLFSQTVQKQEPTLQEMKRA